MLEHFADWHRDAGVEVNAETSPKHEKALDEYLPEASEIISFARRFYGLGKPEDSSVDKFEAALRLADPTFSSRDSKQLLRVLVGAELVAVIKRDGEEKLSDCAALCLLCGAAQGLRTGIAVPEIPTIAARYIEKRTRERIPDDVEAGGSDVEDKLERLELELRIVSEETNMLWWLISDYSRDLNQSWKVVGLPATPIIAGKELAGLTRVIPGPVAAAAFLDRIIHLCDPDKSGAAVKVQNAIDKTPREWREKYALKPSPSGLDDLIPICNATTLSLTVSDGEKWSPVFEKGTAIEANSKLAPNVLAYQVFMEHLLARLHGDLNK